MGVSKKHAKGRLDKYYHMAKEQGYRARSAFKLIQLNKKYNFLEGSKCLIDLCAAPGGWCQVAAKYMPKPSLIIGVDLVPIKPIPGVITLTEDITTTQCRTALKRELKTWKADTFLHDGAPNVGVSWAQDAFTQSELVLSSLKLATEFLVPGGTFVSKVFRSKDYNKLMWVLGKLFGQVEATKPASSRNVSAEIFVVCRDYLAPKKIDERLLDPKYVFKEVDDVEDDVDLDEKTRKERQGAVLNDLFHPEKRVRHRDGYADGDYTLHTSTKVSDFIESSDFVNLLARSSTLTSDGSSDPYANHPLTTPEIIECIADLKVLGKKDFKALLKWRQDIRLAVGLEKKRNAVVKSTEPEPSPEMSVEEMVAAEAQKVTEAAKKAKKKSRERKAKQLLKLRLGMATPMDIGLEASANGDLGSPDFVFGEKEKPRRTAGIVVDHQLAVQDAENSASSDSGSESDSESDLSDSDEESGWKKRQQLENALDNYYAQYQAKKLEKNPKALVKKVKEQSKSANAFEEWYGVEYDNKLGETSDSDGSASQGSAIEDLDQDVLLTDSDEENSMYGDSESPVNTTSSTGLSAKARQFFENPLFKSLIQSDSASPVSAGNKEKKRSKVCDSSSSEDEEYSKRKTKQEVEKKRPNKKAKATKSSGGFETVPVQEIHAVEEGVDEDDGEDLRITSAAEYTLAKKMIRKSGKRDVLDESFNRYTFNDEEGLPSWFMDEEMRHNKPSLPVTKEAIDVMRSRARALDARPIKKVAEAKFRKQMRTARRLEKATKKAEGLAEDDDVPDRAKLTNISKVMGRAKAKQEKTLPKLVVARGLNRGVKGRPKGVKGRYKMVDPRMKKELRADKRKTRGSGKRKH